MNENLKQEAENWMVQNGFSGFELKDYTDNYVCYIKDRFTVIARNKNGLLELELRIGEITPAETLINDKGMSILANVIKFINGE